MNFYEQESAPEENQTTWGQEERDGIVDVQAEISREEHTAELILKSEAASIIWWRHERRMGP
jgi:hypothetical protein